MGFWNRKIDSTIMQTEYPIYYDKTAKRSKPIAWIIALVLPVLMIVALLLVVYFGSSGESIDKTLTKYVPWAMGLYLGILILYYIIRVKNSIDPSSNNVVIQNDQITIKNISLFLPKCAIYYGKFGSGTTTALGTICYITDGTNTIEICIPELLYDDEFKYTQPWSIATGSYTMKKEIFLKFIGNIASKINFKVATKFENNILILKKAVMVELLKYPKILPYFLTSISFIFLSVAIGLLLNFSNPAPLIPVFVGLAILLVRYRRRKIKNYFIDINNNIFYLKEKASGKEIIVTPVQSIPFTILSYRPYGIGHFWGDFWNTRLELNIPDFTKLKIDTRNIQEVFHPKISFWGKWFGNLYVLFNSCDYIIDNASWKRLAHALSPSSFSKTTFNNQLEQ